MTNFEKAIRNWLKENDVDCNVCFEDDFGYDAANRTIHIGVIGYEEIGNWFEQFLYEYGLEYCGILKPVLSFLHEIGHYYTIENFSIEEQIVCYLSKEFLDGRMNYQEIMNDYWEIPDEFAANIWVINFINTYIEVVEELCNIYVDYWEEFTTIYMD